MFAKSVIIYKVLSLIPCEIPCNHHKDIKVYNDIYIAHVYTSDGNNFVQVFGREPEMAPFCITRTMT